MYVSDITHNKTISRELSIRFHCVMYVSNFIHNKTISDYLLKLNFVMYVNLIFIQKKLLLINIEKFSCIICKYKY